MRLSLMAILVVALVGAWAGPAGATPWEQHVEAGLKALMRNDIGAADRAFERLVPFIDRKNEDPELLFDDCAAIATSYLSIQETDRAAVWAQRALTGMEKLRGPVHIDLVQPLTVLATVRMAQEKVADAAYLAERACRVSWRCGQKPDEALATVAGLLVAVMRRRGQDGAAQELADALEGPTAAAASTGADQALEDVVSAFRPVTGQGETHGGTPAADPEALKRYERLKKFVTKKQGRVGQIEAWFEKNADPKILGASESGREAIRAQARTHWHELTTLVGNIVSASEFLKAAMRAGAVGAEAGAKDREWLEGLLKQAERVETLYGVIDPK